MDFSPDGRYLAVQGGGPDWPLALWLWEKSKLCGLYRPTQASCSHRSNMTLTASDAQARQQHDDTRSKQAAGAPHAAMQSNCNMPCSICAAPRQVGRASFAE